MKSKNITQITAFLLSASIIVGGAIILNQGIISAQTVEDNKVVSSPAIVAKTSMIAEDITSEEKASLMIVKAATKDETDIQIKRKGIMPDNIVPSDKDLSMVEAGYLAANALKVLFDVNIENGRCEMIFTKGNTFYNSDIWYCEFIPANGEVKYNCHINSVTGQVYSLMTFPGSPTIDENYLPELPQFISPDDPEYSLYYDEKGNVKKRLEYMASGDYVNAANNFINAKLSGKEIISSKNSDIVANAIVTVDSEFSVYCMRVDVSLSDGSGYKIDVGINSHDIIYLLFYPNGF